MRSISLRSILGLVAALGLALPAEAHFLWLSLRGEAERAVVLHFSEGRFDDTAPFLNPTLTKASLFHERDALLPTTEGSGYSCPVEPSVTLAGSSMTYGLFERGGPPALLRYDAKGARDLAAAGRGMNLPFEIFARRDGEDLVLTVMHVGEPLPESEVVVVQDGTLHGGEFQTDAKGEVRMPFPASPVFAARARYVDPTKTGTHDGKPYERLVRYSTLCVDRLFDVAIPDGSDPEAWLRAHEAQLRMERLPEGVRGLAGEVTANLGGKRHSIRFLMLEGRFEQFEADSLEGEDLAWARTAVSRALGAVGCHPLLGCTGDVPVQQSKVDGASFRLATSTPVEVLTEDHEIRTLRTRTADGDAARTILESMETESGRILPIVETVVRFQGESIAATASVVRTYTQVGPVHVPAEVREVVHGSPRNTTRTLTFSRVELVR
ncbi:MAG: hypothetical protein AAF957_06240 [Planctomycetota bacterium]